MGKLKEFTEEELQNIIYRYDVLKESMMSLVKEYHTSTKKLKKILSDRGIYIRGLKDTQVWATRIYNVNDDFFKTQSEDMAYWLGMLHSDGCVSSKENMIYIELQRSDKELLEKMNESIKNGRPVKDYTSNSHNRVYENSKLYFHSYVIKNDLKSYGIVPNKTYDFVNCHFPYTLKEEYIKDFIRGIFDGDGSIGINCNNVPFFQIDSTHKDILECIQSYFLRNNIEINIDETKPNDTNKRTVSYYRLRAYCFDKIKKIYDLIYNTNSNLYLQRKKDKFQEILKINE